MLKIKSFRPSVIAVSKIHRKGPSLRLERYRWSTMNTQMNLSVKCTRQRKTKKQSYSAIKTKNYQTHMINSHSSTRRKPLAILIGRKWSVEIRVLMTKRSHLIAAYMYSVKSVDMFVSQRLKILVKRLQWARSHSILMTWRKEMTTKVLQYSLLWSSRSPEIRNLL